MQIILSICFYLVGVYILSENPEHVVVDANHGIHLFYLAGGNILSGNTEHVVIYYNHHDLHK
jgi:hypothetical protein